MVVIGSGPGGQKAAIAAAKLGKSVAVIEQRQMLGGVCVNTGTIPSKTLREAVLYLTGMNQRELYGASYRVKDKITPADLLSRTSHVIGKQAEMVRNQLMRNRVDLIAGQGRFRDEHTLLVEDHSRGERTTVSGEYIVIATGTTPARPEGVEFDEQRVLDSDGILDLKSIPASMVVVGAGVIGVEYASMFAALGTKVTIVEKRRRHAGLLRPRDHRGAALPPARPGGDVPLRRRGDPRPGRLDGHRHQPGQRQEDPRRNGDVLGGPARPDRKPRTGARGPGSRRPRPDLRRRDIPDQGRPHLRRRRRHRLPRAGIDLDGPGPGGGLPRVRRAGARPDRATADRHLLDPGDLLRRRHRSRSDQAGRSPTRWVCPATASWPAARSPATPTAC